MFGIKYNGTLQAAPGHGYRIRLHDFANDSIIYAKSELFEIKAVGADPTIPVPWGSSQPSATSTIDISNIITQGLVPSVGTAAPGAAATELAGESPLTDTRINFPTMLDWWVVGALNQVEWTFVHPSKDAEEVTMDLILDNLDTTLCPEPVKVTSVRAHWGKWGGTSQLEG
ncbi:uncharacterized protein COLE_01977 [Cutaneotrichosporon oleaginosum]|nr:hypothetical protein COLE_01977 [Cutaneotrichosporon oleaginosum]